MFEERIESFIKHVEKFKRLKMNFLIKKMGKKEKKKSLKIFKKIKKFSKKDFKNLKSEL